MTSEWLERQAENRDLAEVRVLGTALARADLCDLTVSRVGPEMFRREAHQIIAEAIWSLRMEGKDAGPEEVLNRLVGRGQTEHVGGASALFDLLRYDEGSVEAVEDLLRIERRRRVYQTCMDGARDVTNPDVEPDEIAAMVFGRLRDSGQIEQKAPITTDELLEMERPRWLIDGVLPEGLSVLFGSPKAGKSYVALTIAWALATGRSWFSHSNLEPPKQVLYLAGEGVGDLRLRAESMLEHTNLHPGGRLAWWPVALQFAKESDAARLRLEVEKTEAEVVIVDTWARYAGIRDENDAAQTQAALAALESLTLDGRSVIVVHHTAKSGVMRGSSALAGAVEAAVRVQVNDLDGRVRLSSELSRRGVGFNDILLRWNRVGPDSVLMEDRP